MANTKISGLTELAEAPASGDLLVLVDVSDATMAASGTDKKITSANALSGTVLLAPASTARNTLTAATATVTPLTIKSTDDSATLPLLDLQTSAGVSVIKAKTAIGGASTLDNFLNVTATLPAAPSIVPVGVTFNITTAGSAGTRQQGVEVNLNAGFTGAAQSYALNVRSFVYGTGTAFLSGGNTAINANSAGVSPNNAINKTGVIGQASTGGQNVGLMGFAIDSTVATATNVGVFGVAVNTNATSPIQIGGAFYLSGTAYPTWESTALLADNGAQAVPIAVFRDNGTAVLSIVDGGNLTFGEAINIVTGATTGTKIGTATSQKIGIWNATPIVQPTTAIAAATFVSNTSLIANDTATWDGYTIGQAIKALRNWGALA